MKRRVLLAAGLVRDIEFSDQESFDLYLYALQHRKFEYEVLETFVRSDGSIVVRIVQAYNSVPLIQLFN